MNIKSAFRVLTVPLLACWLLGLSSANAQAPGKVAQPSQDSAFSKEKLFDGTGLSTEQQNAVMGNLLKSQMGAAKKGVLNQSVFEEPALMRPRTGPSDMGVFGAPGPLRPHPPISAMSVPSTTTFGLPPVTDPCAAPATDQQLKALHALLSATIAAKSLDDTKTFAAKAPNGCNAERLRYYLNVITQLFPDGS